MLIELHSQPSFLLLITLHTGRTGASHTRADPSPQDPFLPVWVAMGHFAMKPVRGLVAPRYSMRFSLDSPRASGLSLVKITHCLATHPLHRSVERKCSFPVCPAKIPGPILIGSGEIICSRLSQSFSRGLEYAGGLEQGFLPLRAQPSLELHSHQGSPCACENFSYPL